MTPSRLPIALIPNKTWRGYAGGRELDRFRGIYPGADDSCPEAWVGSVTPVQRPREDKPNLGLGEARFGGGTVLVRDLIAQHAEDILGAEHLKKYGAHPQILVKLLDAEKQLGLQCHPTRAFAKAHYNLPYGKTESWYVLALRDDSPVRPYVLLGFKDGITKEDFAKGYYAGDIAAMEDCLHKFYVQPGEMYFVDGGAPHAIGPGVLVVEVQEPSDITIGARRRQFDDPAEQEKQDNLLLDTYVYDGGTEEEIAQRWRIAPQALKTDAAGCESLLLGSDQTPYFAITRINAAGAFAPKDTGRVRIAIVTRGEGVLHCGGQTFATKRGDEWLLPATAGEIVYEGKGGELEVVLSHPPEVY